MDVKSILHASASFLEEMVGYLPPETQAKAAETVANIKSVAEATIDAEVEKVAGPTFGPEIVSLINGALDQYAAKVNADAAAALASIAAAKSAITPAA